MPVPIESRRPNHTLRSIRLAMRMSQTELARAVRQAGSTLGEPNNCNKRLVQKWESGEHSDCRPNYRRALEKVTRTPVERLGFAFSNALPRELADLVEQAAGVALTRPGPHPDTRDAAPDSAARLRYALATPSPADDATVDVTEKATAQLYATEPGTPAGRLITSAFAHLDDTAALRVGTVRPALRRRLTFTGGASAALAGWLAYETGRAQEADRLWDTAMAAARHGGDPLLVACICAYRSIAVAERGDPKNAWQLVHNALPGAREHIPTQAWLTALAATYSAHQDAKHTAVDEISRALADSSRLTSASHAHIPWARFVDGAYLNATAAHIHAQLNDPITALAHAERAWQLLGPSKTKTRALVLAHIAYAAACANRPELLATCAREAAYLTETLETTQARNRLRALRTLIQPIANEPDYRDTYERLNHYTTFDNNRSPAPR